MSLSSHKRQCAVKFSAACWLRLLFALCILAVPLASGSSAQAAQTISPQEKALALLETLTPAERVGQLFMVTFQGSDASPESEIAQLIQNYYVGGVVLLAANDNFNLESEIPKQVLDLSRQMQLNRWSAAQNPQADIITGEPINPAFIPLFVGMAQEGDGYPFDQVLSGLTQLPSAMALGATWQPQIARDMGAILGTELSALGVNMLLGPSLDVLETPHTSGASDLGVRTFGGDPFWVGKMGQAYIAGVHEGSQGRIAVAAKHFPGHGGSDRLPEEEVATVRRSLEQLTNFELEPFFAVTGGAPSPTATVEALIVSHIRYQGFQGNIRVTTRPVSFDPQAFNLLLEQGPIKTWRESGGVMISDNLGSQA
ncbi:MAG TPA: glycoside hydrolase family 3 N-terminal domain-containing protein, partial [Anaerolineales bacterium]|nr:glycoside hydrolase family 3 N-terminal domain-containing protein [Anaerolineales bacterium]